MRKIRDKSEMRVQWRKGGNLQELARELGRALDGEVRFDRGSRALYATDASNYRQVPIGLVIPRHLDDLVAVHQVCRRHGVPILLRGCGTSLAGQTCNVAVVVDTSKYLDRVEVIDPVHRFAVVEPGVRLDELRQRCLPHQLTFAPDPATHAYCTLGGMIGNNSGGVHSVMGGMTVDNVESLEVLTYRGVRLTVGATPDAELERLIRSGGAIGDLYAQLRDLRDRHQAALRQLPKLARRASGFGLDHLLPENGFQLARALTGTEGTCVTVLKARLRLVDNPPKRSLLVLGYANLERAAQVIPRLMTLGVTALEGLDDRLVQFMRKKGLREADLGLLPEGKGWLLLEFGGATQEEADQRARHAMTQIPDHPPMQLYSDADSQTRLWKVRESGLGATAFVPGESDSWPGWEDSAVPVEHFAHYLGDLRRLMDRYGYHPSFYGHFGQGLVHCRVGFDLTTVAGIAHYKQFVKDAAALVASHGGVPSGEHGDGQAKAELLPEVFSPEQLQAFQGFKAIWDPDGKMNPGKAIQANPLDSDLRLGSDYHPWEPDTRFRFPNDGGKFSRAAMRCVGVGKCRKLDTGTMCPSFMVLRDETHTTRGRARLLFEMLRGSPIQERWGSPEVKEALDLCLSCKGCKGECPVNVDMATYKAEFLHHFHRGRPRSRQAYSMGLIFYWARMAAVAPGLVNWVMHLPGFSRLAKWIAGMAPERDVPRFAPKTFREWAKQRTVANPDGPHVLLWPDTFHNHFHPETAIHAVEVLESLGWQVVIPTAPVCCGRPLYDFGKLDLARQFLLDVLEQLTPAIEAGMPVVGLEPSCVSVFRDEMREMLPDDQRAAKLAGLTMTLSQFLDRENQLDQLPKLAGQAVVHGHCHHKAILGFESEKKLLDQLGLDHHILDSGCCGMAGNFGFESAKQEVAKAIGERVLLPAVRNASPDAWLITEGFSCQEQVRQHTGKRTVHTATLIHEALAQAGKLPRPRASKHLSRAWVFVAAAAGWWAWQRLSKRRET